jgi:UDP-N-acetylglucosamine--N-acetylmuramyl-(pentapeptide) pyrophosphoryl-undecaprenol N-acetylglucosamine transferase
MRVVLTGGGTGGHVIPFEPMVTALRTQFLEVQPQLAGEIDPSSLSIYFVGVALAETREFFARLDVPVTNIPSGKLRRYASGLTVIDLFFRLPVGIIMALVTMWRLMPEVVISKGGYGSIPVVLAAVFYRIPVLLHESDAKPGMANKFLMRFAAALTLGFAAAQAEVPAKYTFKAIVTGTPVREDIKTLSSAEGKKVFGIAPSEKVLLVMGGSQGAKQLNEALLQLLPKLVLQYTIIHLTGTDHFTSVTTVAQELLAQSSRKAAYQAFPYLTDQMPAALTAADGIISRAGSSVVEFMALRKPMLLIPLDSAAGDHQRRNAQVVEAAGAALVLDPNNLGVNLLAENIERLMNDETLRGHMMANQAALDKPQAAHDIVAVAYKLAQGLAPTNGGR